MVSQLFRLVAVIIVMPHLLVSFDGRDLGEIARKAKAWADEYLGQASDGERLIHEKAQKLVYGISDGSRRVLRPMVELAVAGTVPTPPLVMKKLGTKPADEQGVRAVIGRVRRKMESLDSTLGGPPLLADAPFIGDHTHYQFGPKAAEAIKAELDGLDKLISEIGRS